MDSKELVIRSLNFDSPSRVPRQCWVLPWAAERYPREVSTLARQYPDDIVPVPGIYRKPTKMKGNRYEKGKYTDEWGCKFNNIQAGLIGVPDEPLINDWSRLEDFRTPDEVLDIDREQVSALCRRDGKFTYSQAWIRPFERYQFIRTTENAMIDIATESDEMKELISIIHRHYLRETEAWAETDVDAIGIMDDWGMQNGMMVPPEFFRKYYKEQYREYAEIARSRGKYVFMHSDGKIDEIIPDLIEVGINALNSQLFCMDIKKLGERFRGRMTFWGEIDRQSVLPDGDRSLIETAVKEVYKNLWADGGIIAQCEFGPAAKPENIFYVFDSWNNIL